MMRSFDRPFIVIGCHRSGTSWLSLAMHLAGIHMGVHRDHNEEAMHFLSLNQQAMSSAGCRWDSPCIPSASDWPIIHKRELIKIHFQEHQRRLHWWRAITGNTLWGWKDPRNTFTLPHWLSVFPQARVIHLVRSREEVVNSLLTREFKHGEVRSNVQQSEEEAAHLWEVYTAKAREYEVQLKGRYLEVDYNQLSSSHGDALNNFCGKDVKFQLQQTKRVKK